MSLINCPECGKEVSERAITCPNCGVRIGNGHSKKSNKMMITFLLIFALFCTVAIIFIGLSGSLSDSKSTDYNNDNTNRLTNNSIATQKYTSYEEILNDYSAKLDKATPECIESFINNAQSNDSGLSGLAEIANNEVERLAEIANDGISEMAEFMVNHGSGKYDEYEEWSKKLMDLYQDYSEKVLDAYTEYATK